MYSTVSQWTSGGGRQATEGAPAQHKRSAGQYGLTGVARARGCKLSCKSSCGTSPVHHSQCLCAQSPLGCGHGEARECEHTEQGVACGSMRLVCVTAYLEAKCPCHGPWRENLEHVWECTKEAESNTHKPKKQQREVRKGGCCCWCMYYLRMRL